MRNVSISHVGLVFLLAYASSAQAQGYSFTGLGDLPNGTSWNRAYGISADGLVVVGTARTDSGREAFRWTRDEGMVSLGDLPGGEIDASAEAASADGSVIVGTGRGPVYRLAGRKTVRSGPPSRSMRASVDGASASGAGSFPGLKAGALGAPWEGVGGIGVSGGSASMASSSAARGPGRGAAGAGSPP